MQSILNDSPKNLIAKYRQALAKSDITVESLILFGSHATGTHHEGSDIDVCVVSPQFGKNSFDEMVMLAKIAAPIDPLIEPHPYSPSDLQDPWDPLAQEIRTHGVVVES